MRPRPLFLTVVCGCALSFALAAAGPPISPETRITQVTVYGDRADVRRVAEGVRLRAGDNVVAFGALPAFLDAGSVRASGRGDDRVSIVNVDVSRSAEPFPAPSDSLQAELAATEARMRELEARKAGLDAGRQFLDSVRLSRSAAAGPLLEAGMATPEQLRGTLALLTEEVGNNRSEADEADEELRRLRERDQLIRREMSHRSPVREPVWNVLVELEAEAATEIDLTLDYTTAGATWSAEYDVVVPEDLGSIGIVYAATVSQSTGEDWSDVAVSLSSAQPSLGARLPTLDPWWLVVPSLAAQAGVVTLGDQVFVRGGRASDVQTAVEAPKLDMLKAETSGVRRIDTKAESRIRAINTTESVLDASGVFATSFEIPNRQDLPSDGRSRRLRITSFDVEGEVEHESVPKLSPRAFLVASVRNSSDFPMLPGPTRVLLGGNFVGQGSLGAVAPGQEFDLPLGVDHAVTVERKVVRRRDDESGSRRESATGLLIEVTNHRRAAVTLTLRDQVPISADEDVQVRVRDVEPAPVAKPGAEGLLEWKLEIPAGERREARFGYEVKYPSDRKPRNL